jgi:PAS domain S-box-containing protein
MENDRMFKELVEISNDITIVTDDSFRIQYISSAVSKNFNVKPIDLIGESISKFISCEKIATWKEKLQRAEMFLSEELTLTNLNGKRVYFDVGLSQIKQETYTRNVFRLHDVTLRKEKELDLERSNLQLDQVIYKTTHDLKAPLMSAIGLIALAEKAPVEENNKYLELVKKSILKLDTFIEEMNDFFRNEKLAVQRDKINIEELLKEEFKNLENFNQEPPIEIEFVVKEEIEFYSDSIRVRTIVANILSNALKYSDHGKLKPFIKISVSLTADFCEITIADNGIGIESQYQDKIFDLFFRGTDQSHGTGLGLFIVKDTIEKLGGSIKVNSTLGQGTTFLIRIPNQILQPIEVD